MPEWLLAIIVLALYAAMWFWVGHDFGKDRALEHLNAEKIELDREEADALETAAKADGMPMGEWILRQAVAEARRRQG